MPVDRRISINGSGVIYDSAGELGPEDGPVPASQSKPSYPSPVKQMANFGKATAKWGAEPTDTAGILGPTPGKLPLGDYTERLLRSVGITEDRYKDAKEELGMAPTCNCHERKLWLNRAGDWLARKVAGG